ncbi:hypothetical protein HPB50_001560 [Hyalomma asiaticum]|uniref:Uncharacterized protein n=1 Tax=Hyalomma asiaticum TaxID=266040 RepID=A0ACB7SJV9_HYAAI|nr:hypothetical protein HPB50_001560 [Hyalomma asiaticum]
MLYASSCWVTATIWKIPGFAQLQDAVASFKLQTAAAPIEHRADFWPNSISGNRRRKISKLNAVIRDLVQKNEETKDNGRARSYIDLFTEKIRESENHSDEHFTGDNLVGDMVDIMTGAATSGNYYLHWHLLNLASRADTLQADLREEIDAVVGSDRSPRWEDHASMPLTMATIWEMFRWKVATPFNLPRANEARAATLLRQTPRCSSRVSRMAPKRPVDDSTASGSEKRPKNVVTKRR